MNTFQRIFSDNVIQCKSLSNTIKADLMELTNQVEVRQYLTKALEKEYNLELDWLVSTLNQYEVNIEIDL
jgi:hypothetical protein